jgi:hypothetical protein
MPRDELCWRAVGEAALFLPQRRTPVAHCPTARLLVAVVVWQQPTAGLMERVQRVMEAGGAGAPQTPQASASTGGTGTADAGFTQTPDIQQGEPSDPRD